MNQAPRGLLMHKVAVIVGSLRRESINLRLARALIRLGEKRFDFHLVKLDDVPMYNDDYWADPPASVTRLKADIAAADAVLFVTPEYNRSIPALVKNTVDWGTRPRGQNSWGGKPAAIVGTSQGAIGTAVAQAQLRSILSAVGVILMGLPEVYLTYKPELIDEEFRITDESTAKFLSGFLDKFDAWIKRLKSPAT